MIVHLSDALQSFLGERHLATLVTLRADGPPVGDPAAVAIVDGRRVAVVTAWNPRSNWQSVAANRAVNARLPQHEFHEAEKPLADVFFDYDKSDLKPAARATLDKQSAWLKQYGQNRVVIEGHCDERGTREYNIALSARRATATREFLLAQGVDASRISTIAYGKERPVALCDAEQCWSQNRRAVTVITGGAKTS